MRKAALVLSGGGAMGAAHIGALAHLEKRFHFDYLLGVSAGAIVAAGIACGKTAAEISAFAAKQKFFHLAFDWSWRKLAFLKGEKILGFLEDFYERRGFEDLPSAVQLTIATTDFSSGEQVLLSSGSIAKAVRASIAVPLLLEPYFHQDRWLMDGGFSQNFPLDTAMEEYAGRMILGIDVCSFFDDGRELLAEKFGKVKTLRRLAERSLRILYKNQQRHFPQDARAIVIRPDLSGFSPWDLRHLKAMEARGLDACQKILSEHGLK